MKKTDTESLYFLGLDVGNSSCKAVLSTVTAWNTLDFEVCAAAEMPTDHFVERGSIVNMEKAGNTIHALMKQLQNSAAISENAVVYGALSIEDAHVISHISKARYPFSKYSRQVTSEDLYKVREMASNSPLQNGKDYLHIMTRNYRVDERLPKRNPEGELGLSLEAELFLVSVRKQEIAKYQQCVQRAAVPIHYMCTAPIAAAEGVLTRLEKEQTTLLIDIGAQTTSAVLFDDNVPKTLAVLPLGSNDVTRDISRIMHVPEPLSEKVKQHHAFVDEMYFSQSAQTVTAHENEYDQTFTIQKQDLYKISYARMYEIFKLLYKQLHITEFAHAYPVVLTGGGSCIVGCKQMLEKLTGAKVRMAQPWNWGGPVSDYRMPRFSTSVGLCVVAARHYMSSTEIGKKNISAQSTRSHNKPTQVKKFFDTIGNTMKRFFSFGEIE